MNIIKNIKESVARRRKLASRKTKDKELIKQVTDFIEENPKVYYKEVRSYYKKHKRDKDNKVVKKYEELMGEKGPSVTEYFDNYYKGICGHMIKRMNKNRFPETEIKKCKDSKEYKMKFDLYMDKTFEALIIDEAKIICKGFKEMYKNVLKDQSVLVKNFLDNSKKIRKGIMGAYHAAEGKVKSAYEKCKTTFENVVEKHILNNKNSVKVENIKIKELRDLAKVIMGRTNSKYRISKEYEKGGLEKSIKHKYYLVGMQVDKDNKERVITPEEARYDDKTLKKDVTWLITTLSDWREKTKFVKKEDIEMLQRNFNRDCFSLQCCILGMEEFAEKLPRMVKQCAIMLDENIRNEEYKKYMDERINQEQETENS